MLNMSVAEMKVEMIGILTQMQNEDKIAHRKSLGDKTLDAVESVFQSSRSQTMGLKTYLPDKGYDTEFITPNFSP